MFWLRRARCLCRRLEVPVKNACRSVMGANLQAEGSP